LPDDLNHGTVASTDWENKRSALSESHRNFRLPDLCIAR